MFRPAPTAPVDAPSPRPATRVLISTMLVASAVMTAIVVTSSDSGVLSFITEHRSTWLVRLAKVVTTAGDAMFLIPVALVGAFVLWRRRTGAIIAAAPSAALLCAGVITAIGKSAIGRRRPPVFLHLVTENEPSMPSGHTADGTAFYVALAVVVIVLVCRTSAARRATAVVASVVCIGIGLSRLELGVHWPTDVLVSWALGTLVGTAVVAAASQMQRARSLRADSGPVSLRSSGKVDAIIASEAR